MSIRKLVSTTLIAAAVLSTPALARENHITALHFAKDAGANTIIGAGHYDRHPCYGTLTNGARGGLCGYGDRDVWVHRGSYYGPMVGVP
jgi:hypothetical protein